MDTLVAFFQIKNLIYFVKVTSILRLALLRLALRMDAYLMVSLVTLQILMVSRYILKDVVSGFPEKSMNWYAQVEQLKKGLWLVVALC
jgi:hypothetical protein